MKKANVTEFCRVVMKRDGISLEEFREQLQAAVEDYGMDDPEELLREGFGLEPDYIFDLIDELARL